MNEITHILQTIFSNASSWMKFLLFWLKFIGSHRQYVRQSVNIGLGNDFIWSSNWWARSLVPFWCNELKSKFNYSDVIMSAMASQITGVSIVYSTVCSGAVQRKHQSSASLAFVRGIHRWPVNSPHKGPVTRIMFPFDDVIMLTWAVLFVRVVLSFKW